MKTLLLSAHLDDAVLSAGQFLANQPGCDVLTVFAGIPRIDGATPYDAKCGFRSSKAAMKARRLEDRDALARLKCEPIYWDFLDGQYISDAQFHSADHLTSLKDAIIEVAFAYDLIIGPLGLVHADHLLLGDALISVTSKIKSPIYLWEDLPNRVLHPDKVYERLINISAVLEPPGGAGPMASKINALHCYRSQMGTGDLDFNLVCVPERFWKLKRKDMS